MKFNLYRVAVTIAVAAALWILPQLSCAAITPKIISISNPVFVGGSMTITGSGFNGRSVANFFVATSKGAINFGPLQQSGNTGTTLTIPVLTSKVRTLGEGVVSVVVVNTDQGSTRSNAVTAQLFGENADGFPNLITINRNVLAATSTDPSFATDNVESVVVQNQRVTLGGNGFDTVHGVAIDLYCDCLPDGKLLPTLFLTPGNAGLSATALSFTLPASAVTGPGSFVVSNKGVNDYAIKSNAVSVPVGAVITVSRVTQTGCTVTVDGTGFAVLQPGLPRFTVINLFNQQRGGVVNLGGLNSSAAPVIPLNVISADQFTFSLAGVAFAPGPSYVQVLNPPFVPFTSSGNTPNGAFTAVSCGPTPTPSRTRTPSLTPTPTATTTATARVSTATPTATRTPAPTPSATPTQVSLFVLNGCSGTVTSYKGDNGDIAPNKLSVFLCPSDLAFDSNGNLYVANRSWITVYPAGSSGNTVPSATIIGPKTTLQSISGIAVDLKGNIYASDSSGEIVEFAAGSTGNVAPLAQITGANTGLNLPQAVAVDSDGNIYVANEGGDDILVFAAGSNGNVTPSKTIKGSNTGLAGPIGVSLDHQNNIYVVSSGCAPNDKFVGQSITVYPAGSKGNVTPTAMIAGSNTGLNNFTAGIAADSAGNIFISGLTITISGRSTPMISEFAAGSTGNVAPQHTISGANTGFGQLIGRLAVNQKSSTIGVIVDESAPPYIEQFPSESTGNVAPVVVLGNLAPQMNLPVSVAVDGSGKIYVANTELGGFGGGCPPIEAANRVISESVSIRSQNSITIYAPGSSADAPPIATISGANTGVNFPEAVAVDATKIYVANADGGSSFEGSITEYPINSNGNVSPGTVISGPDTGLEFPTGIALDVSGDIYVANASGGSDSNGSITIYAPASSGDAKPIVTISGSNTALSRPQSIGVDNKGNIYVGNAGNNSITVYPASGKGNVAPSATIKGSNTGLTPTFAGFIAVDSSGNIFASIGGIGGVTSSVLIFRSASNGNVAPAAILSGPHTQLAEPQGLAVVTP